MRLLSRIPLPKKKKKLNCKTLNAFFIIVIAHRRGLRALGDLRAEIGAGNGDQAAEPPSEARITGLQAHSVEEARKSRAKSSAQACCRRRNAIDRPENLLRWGRICQENRVARVCHCRKCALPDDQEINGGHSQTLREEHHIRRDKVQRKVREGNEAEEAKRSQSAGDGRHNQIIGQQGIKALNGDNDTNGLCVKTESVYEFEWELEDWLAGRSGAQKNREELIVCDGVASKPD